MRNRLFARAAAALACLALCAPPALPAPAVTVDRLERQVMAYVQQNRFHGSVLVARDGNPILQQGYGFANLEWRIPNSSETRFRLGSITKMFTAAAILLLEADGKLATSDPVSKHLDNAPEAWKDITLHHLLTHTSGIPNFTGFPDYAKTMMLASPPLESIRKFRDKPLDFPPGAKFNYSNSGYVLLGYLVEKISGMPYEEFLRRRILGPAGMEDTGYDHGETVLKYRAEGYVRAGGREVRHAPVIDMSIPHGAGALYSTTADLLKWDRALAGDKILTAAMKEKYFRPEKNNYAYGWVVNQRDGVNVQGHDGGINGFSTSLLRAPEKGVVVVALCNLQPCEPGRVTADLLQLALDKEVKLPEPRVTRKEIPLAPEVLGRYVGEYELGPGFVVKMTVDNGKLMGEPTGQPKLELAAESETRFFLKVVDAQIEFQRDSGTGAVTGMKLFQNGREMPAKKIR